MSVRYKLVLAYLGRPFHGWQRQRSAPTVQGKLEQVLTAVVDIEGLRAVGAGRTDAGVHAAGQVAHVDFPAAIPADGLLRGLNSRLPPEIRVRKVVAVGERFHARASAVGKRYTYRASWQPSLYPWRQLRTAIVAPVARMQTMVELAERLPGHRDWASFTVTEPDSKTTVRTLFGLEVRPRPHGVDFVFLGEGFLRYQVRRMVGALLEIGRGRRDPDWLLDLLAQPQPGAPIETAAARGLTLDQVYYRRNPRLTPPANLGTAASKASL
ncbi:MAG: tRNA pseudouridine(38-40) synthase TruA [Holophagae bacterium]